MPELAEVEVVRRGVAERFVPSTVEYAEVFDARAVKPLGAGTLDAGELGLMTAEFLDAIKGASLTSAQRRGKFMWLTLDGSDHAVAVHLGMTGQVRSVDPDEPHLPHERIRLHLTGESHEPQPHLAFCDQRLFGYMRVVPLVDDDGDIVPDVAQHIARDVLHPRFDADATVDKLGRTSSPIKVALLRQELISGLGNIYVDETLWRTKVRFDTPASRLSMATRRALIGNAQDVLTEAIAAGGTTFDEAYVHVNGQSGYFVRLLNAYGRAGEPCGHCGTTMERAVLAKRSSYFCPACQPPMA